MPPQQLEFEARVYWRTGRVFKFLKWPSAHEVDFGAFLVEYDLKRGKVSACYRNGEREELGAFHVHKGVRSITGIIGEIEVCGGHRVQLHPATPEQPAKVCYSLSESGGLDGVIEMGSSRSQWRVAENLCLSAVVEGRDAYLKVCCAAVDRKLSLVLASMVVFLRFSH